MIQVTYVPRLLRDDSLVPHLGQATGVPRIVSAVPRLSHARGPGTFKGCLTTKLDTLRRRPDGNARDHRAVQGEAGGSASLSRLALFCV